MHHRMAPVLKRVDDQMCEHTWVVALGPVPPQAGFRAVTPRCRASTTASQSTSPWPAARRAPRRCWRDCYGRNKRSIPQIGSIAARC